LFIECTIELFMALMDDLISSFEQYIIFYYKYLGYQNLDVYKTFPISFMVFSLFFCYFVFD